MVLSTVAGSKIIQSVLDDSGQGVTPRPALWADVPDEKWNDWRWQMSSRLNTMEELEQVIRLTGEERGGLTMAPAIPEDILRKLREIPHVEIVHIGSRAPGVTVGPMRMARQILCGRFWLTR